MWPFNRARRPPAPRLVELDERLHDVERSIEWLKRSDRELNARISAVQRKTAAQDAPGATIDTPAGTGTPPLLAFPRDRSRRGF